MKDFEKDYELIRGGKTGYHIRRRGLFRVGGDEAIQFLNGLITNDISKLQDGEQLLAAFPTLKGRMFAVVRVMRRRDEFLFETEEETRQKVHDNLFRFTFAGDFHVEDVSENFDFFTFFGNSADLETAVEGVLRFQDDYFVPKKSADEFISSFDDAVNISDELYEVLRIENGIPKYGIDMDEETVVPEVGLDGIISYEKGCYIGQEVIARIHFRGKVAKELIGLVFEDGKINVKFGDEITSFEDKNAGRITSVAFSPKLGKVIALAYVRNAYLDEGTRLKVGEIRAVVANLPFV